MVGVALVAPGVGPGVKGGVARAVGRGIGAAVGAVDALGGAWLTFGLGATARRGEPIGAWAMNDGGGVATDLDAIEDIPTSLRRRARTVTAPPSADRNAITGMSRRRRLRGEPSPTAAGCRSNGRGRSRRVVAADALGCGGGPEIAAAGDSSA
jgi:hypothetical protein